MRIEKYVGALLLTAVGSANAFAESGLASFYPGVGSKRGEMTCAHRSHAFGKILKVTHGKVSIQCRVNDRGPFIKGRIVDVSTSAARALGMMSAGVVPVRIEVVEQVSDTLREAERKPEPEELAVPAGAL